MAVRLIENLILFELCDTIFDSDADFSQLMVIDFLASREFWLAPMPFYRQHGSKPWEILVDSLIAAVGFENTPFRDDLRQTGFLEKRIVMGSPPDRGGYVEDETLTVRGDLGFYGELPLLARMVRSSLPPILWTRDRLFSGVREDVIEVGDELAELFEGSDLLATLVVGERDTSGEQRRYHTDGTGARSHPPDHGFGARRSPGVGARA